MPPWETPASKSRPVNAHMIAHAHNCTQTLKVRTLMMHSKEDQALQNATFQ